MYFVSKQQIQRIVQQIQRIVQQIPEIYIKYKNCIISPGKKGKYNKYIEKMAEKPSLFAVQLLNNEYN